jgi:MFS transporter, DHA2 family, multidrug resistance protein
MASAAGTASRPNQIAGVTGYRRLGLTIASMLGMISMIMTSTMVNVAVPDIMGAYGLGQDQAHWMSTGFLAAMTVSMLLNAWLVSNFGPRNVYITAVAVFSIAAVLGQISPTYSGVVAARVGQGVCAGLIQSLAMSTVFLAYPPHERGKAMGWFGMGVVLGPVIGPVIGGIIVDDADWRYVFSAAVPVLVLGALLAWIFLPGRDERAERVSFNPFNFGLITASFILFLNGITTGQREGWGTDPVFFMLFGSAVSLIAFIILESRTDKPLLQLRLFRYPVFAASAVVAFTFGAGMFGSIYLTPIMVQTVQGFTATKSGLLLIPGGLVAMAVFPIAGRLTQTVRQGNQVLVGLLIFSLSSFWLAEVDMLTGFWVLALTIAFGRIGLGLVIPALNLGALNSVPQELVPFAAGTLNFVRMTGASVGTNTLAIVLDHRAAEHGARLVSTQTAGNREMTGLIDRLVEQLATGGLPANEQVPAAMSYLRSLLKVKADELAFQDGFMVLAVGFLLTCLTALLLLRVDRK